jgi:hypothetical protein
LLIRSGGSISFLKMSFVSLDKNVGLGDMKEGKTPLQHVGHVVLPTPLDERTNILTKNSRFMQTIY